MSAVPKDVLLVEDNPGDIRLMMKAFSKVAATLELHVVKTGGEARDFLGKRGAYEGVSSVDLILLDLNLPDCRGQEVLREIKEDQELRRIPVVILSSSEDQMDIISSYDEHANAYLTKPLDFKGLMSMVQDLDEFWFTLTRLAPKEA